MYEFSTEVNSLKKALSVVSLATDDKTEIITGHAVFKPVENQIKVYSADNKEKMAFAFFPITDFSGDPEPFTCDPKKITALLNSTKLKSIKFVFNPDSHTLNIYASENDNSYLSFASFDPDKAISFEDQIEKSQLLKTLNADIFMYGIKFIQGFLSVDDKEENFNQLYLIDGIMYGSNGSNKIGAFDSTDFKDIDKLIIRKSILPASINLIEKTGISTINIKTTSKSVFLMGPENHFGFGFLKTTTKSKKEKEPIKFPINKNIPDTDGFNLDRTDLIKKLNRLAITSSGNLGIKSVLGNDKIELSTLSERPSFESIKCKRIKGEKEIEFILEYKLTKSILNLYQATNIDVYINRDRCTIRSEAELEIKDNNKIIRKPFRSVALVSLARKI